MTKPICCGKVEKRLDIATYHNNMLVLQVYYTTCADGGHAWNLGMIEQICMIEPE